MRGLPGRATRGLCLINAFAETLEQGNGRGGNCSTNRPPAPGMQSVASCFQESEHGLLLPMAALEIPWPGPGPLPPTLIRPAWALPLVHREAVRCRSAAICHPRRHLGVGHWKRLGFGDSARLFSDPPVAAWTVALPPNHPEGGGA